MEREDLKVVQGALDGAFHIRLLKLAEVLGFKDDRIRRELENVDILELPAIVIDRSSRLKYSESINRR
jgi:hypothetical protein